MKLYRSRYDIICFSSERKFWLWHNNTPTEHSWIPYGCVVGLLKKTKYGSLVVCMKLDTLEIVYIKKDRLDTMEGLKT